MPQRLLALGCAQMRLAPASWTSASVSTVLRAGPLQSRQSLNLGTVHSQRRLEDRRRSSPAQWCAATRFCFKVSEKAAVTSGGKQYWGSLKEASGEIGTKYLNLNGNIVSWLLD